MTADLRTQLQAALGEAYTLERELGGAGMSRVFVATETRLARPVVVKLLSPELAAGISAERFQREIRVAASLQQANIVPLLSTGEAGGLPYYTMPFVEGQSLRRRLAEGALSIPDIVRILGDVARALTFAHEHRIVHRDIKPDNVLLSGGTAVVTDFGIAKALTASRTHADGVTLTQLGTSLGTPAYMSPEQVAGDPNVDHRADIYAFGCLAYELLAGRPPFDASTPHRVLAAHLSEAPQPVTALRADTPPVLADLVMRCLEKHVESRPQQAADLVNTLDNLTSSTVSSVVPAFLRRGKGMFRRALLVYLGAFAGVALTAKAATVIIGLPDWVFPGALVVMLLGLPVILFTGYVQRATHQVLTTLPERTPGGGTRTHGTLAQIAVKASPHITWRRAAIGGAVALGVFAVLIGAFMTSRALGIGPAATLLSSGRLKERERVVLADFRITNADSSLGRVVSDMVRQGLSESSAITLVPPTTLVAVLGRMQQPPSARLDLSLAREIALREGVKAIVDGEVAGVGNSYIVTVRVVSADSGIQLASLSATGDGARGLIDAADKATRALREKLGESLRRVQNAGQLAQVTTSTLAALRKYSEAYRANSYAGDPVRAVALAREAIEIDTSFAMAWRLMASSMSNAQMPIAGQDSALTRAFALRSRLSERERLFVEGDYHRYGQRRDRPKGVDALDALLALGDTGVAANNLGMFYTQRREFQRADSSFARSRQAAPYMTFPYNNAIQILVELGRADEAARLASAYRDTFPTAVGPQLRLYEVGYHLGRIDEMRRAADSLAESPNRALRSWALNRQQGFQLRDGHPSTSERLFTRARAVDSARGVARVALADSATIARVDVVVRDSAARAVRRMDGALATLPFRSIATVDRPYFAVASLYAIAGRVDKAKAILAQYDAEITDTSLRRVQRPGYHTALGEIALTERRFRDALAEFRRGDSLPDGPVDACTVCLPHRLARVFAAAGESDSAIVMFGRYLQTPHWNRFTLAFDPSLLAGTHERLAQLYEAKGDAVKAAEHYRAFIDLWKNADRELQPRVAEARRRLTRLGSPATDRRPQ